MLDLIKKIYIASSGYSYTHLGRMFLRMFVGIMLIQFGVRQIICFDEYCALFPSIWGMPSNVGLIIAIVLEIFCSFNIMVGFCMRLMILPPFIMMIMAEWYFQHTAVPDMPWLMSWDNPSFMPIMFLGIYFFLLVVGPGKVSFDYFLSLHIIHTEDKSEDELEEV